MDRLDNRRGGSRKQQVADRMESIRSEDMDMAFQEWQGGGELFA